MSARRGAALPAAVLVVLGFAVAIAGAYGLVRVQVRETVYQVRLAQAQAIAEAGLEAALNQVARTSSWKTGYNQRAFAGGYFTVSLSTDLAPIVTATGYSAAVPVMGRAARTVKAQADLDGFYDFSNSTFTMNWYATAYDSDSDDTPACTNTQMQSISSVSALSNTGCRYGLYAHANTKVTIASSTTNPIHWGGDVAYAEPTSTAPYSSAVKGRVLLAASSVTVSNWEEDLDYPGLYLTQNDNNATRISPFAAYSTTTKILSVTAGDVTLASGTFHFKGIVVASSRTLFIQLSRTDQAVNIYLEGNMTVAHMGMIDSREDTGGNNDCGRGTTVGNGGCKACNIHIYGRGGGTITLAGYNTAASGTGKGVRATENITYLDIYAPEDAVVIRQRFLGRVIGRQVDILNPYPGNTRPIFFFDKKCGYAASEGVRWVRGSWSESYYKP